MAEEPTLKALAGALLRREAPRESCEKPFSQAVRKRGSMFSPFSHRRTPVSQPVAGPETVVAVERSVSAPRPPGLLRLVHHEHRCRCGAMFKCTAPSCAGR